METALGASYWFLSKVITKLSDELVAHYVSSSELGLNLKEMEIELLCTQVLLHEAQQRDMTNSDLQGLLEKLNKNVDEAEDALDELHYFRIQDELDGTGDATPDLGDGLRSQALHARHVFRHNIGNMFSCFTCCRSQDDVAAATDNIDKAKPQNDDNVDQAEKLLQFNRVAMSTKIKQLTQEIRSLCECIRKLLKLNQSRNPSTLQRPLTSATVKENKLYGRDAIFEEIIGDLMGSKYNETISVLPIVGPGGIGKTTFIQHVYNDERIKKVFHVRIWICVSINFDVLRLTQEILSCILAVGNENRATAYNTTNLSLLHEDIEKRLKTKRFLIVFDDIWECNNRSDWDNLFAPFKKGETKGNMVLVTTRFPKIAYLVKNEEINPINLQGLEPDEFWKFFQYCVFGEVKDEQDAHDLDIAQLISDKLKCSPLAAKTVGPLLRKNHNREHWIGILHNKEWNNPTYSDDGIMAALKISYDYLPFDLKKCFSYCALFPEDHRFDIMELTRFWDAIGIIDTSGQTDSAEILVDKLVDNGFLIKQQDDNSSKYYMLHDLLHELSQSVSSQECVNINFNNGFIADNIPSSVRYVSITIHEKRSENIDEQMNKLKSRTDIIGNLRTLMIFASSIRDANISANILKDTFNKIKDLRVLFLPMPYQESLPCNFSKLIHLRYLKIETFGSISVPSAISRFYHLKYFILENSNGGNNNVPKDFNRLVNLRHVQASDEFHSSIPGVGKMKCLEMLKEFHVKKESVGFELAELGKLTKLGGRLRICNLDKVKTKEEAQEALLNKKSNLRGLILEFSRIEETTGHYVIEGLQPHRRLKELDIRYHSGATGPSWLYRDICVTSLEYLSLWNISWDILPPFGRLPLLRSLKLSEIPGLRQFRFDSDGASDGSFNNLKAIRFWDMPDLVEWIAGDSSHFFSKLEVIALGGCPNLRTLPFSDSNGLSTEGTDIKWSPCLRKLKICECPKLSHLPPMPYTSTLTYVCVQEDHFERLCYMSNDNWLVVYDYSGALCLEHLGKIEFMSISYAPHILLTDLQQLSLLRQLHVEGDMFSGEVGDGVVIPSVQQLRLKTFHPTGKLLPNVFKCLPALSELEIGHSIEDQGEELVLQFPPSRLLRKIYMYHCNNLILSAEGGGAFRDLTSLQSLTIICCDKIFSRWFLAEASEVINAFPASISDRLSLYSLPDKLSMAVLSNLTSITYLHLSNCVNLTIHGFDPLIYLSLKSLTVTGCGSVAADLFAEVAKKEILLPAGSWQLESLHVDNVSAVLVDPICRRLSTTLRTLSFSEDEAIERFTEDQEKALQLFTALEQLVFHRCTSLQSLPETIDRLCSLNKLRISYCIKIQCLPKCGLPTSLESLSARGCSDELRMELRHLGETHPYLEIHV